MKSKKKIGIIIQSRSSSKRFKLKFKKKILNKSLIIFLLDRIKKDFENTKIIVAIPTGDKIIYDHLKKLRVFIFSLVVKIMSYKDIINVQSILSWML